MQGSGGSVLARPRFGMPGRGINDNDQDAF